MHFNSNILQAVHCMPSTSRPPPYTYAYTGQPLPSLSWAHLDLVGHILYDTDYYKMSENTKIKKLLKIYTAEKAAMVLLLNFLPLLHDHY